MDALKKIKEWSTKNIDEPEDYKQFEKDYKGYLKTILKEIDGSLVSFNRNYYYFSCFVSCNGKFAYISISDVRYFKKDWYNNILVRSATNENDYKGGSNCYANLENLKTIILNLTR